MSKTNRVLRIILVETLAQRNKQETFTHYALCITHKHLPIIRSSITSQKKLCQWSHVWRHNEKLVNDLGVSKHFGPNKSHKKNPQNSQRLLNYTKSSYIIFCPRLLWYSQFIYYSQKDSRHFALNVSKFFALKNSPKKLMKFICLYSLFYSFSTINKL